MDEHVLVFDSRLSIHKRTNEPIDGLTRYTLKIRNVTFDDTGYYMCQISTNPLKQQVCHLNIVGKVQHSSHLYMVQIRIDPRSHPVFVSRFLFLFVASPEFDEDALKNGHTIVVREFDNVTLSCRARGNPPPKIKWRREDGKPIIATSDLRQSYSASNNDNRLYNQQQHIYDENVMAGEFLDCYA